MGVGYGVGQGLPTQQQRPFTIADTEFPALGQQNKKVCLLWCGVVWYDIVSYFANKFNLIIAFKKFYFLMNLTCDMLFCILNGIVLR